MDFDSDLHFDLALDLDVYLGLDLAVGLDLDVDLIWICILALDLVLDMNLLWICMLFDLYLDFNLHGDLDLNFVGFRFGFGVCFLELGLL